MKKKTLVPFVIFLLGICLVSLIVYITDAHENEQRHITAQLNATTYGERIKTEITDGIEITDALKQILISENGEIHQFETMMQEPTPYDIVQMADCYKRPDLCNYYCSHKCAIGERYVPEVEVSELSSIILETIASLNEINPLTGRLIQIARDGKITDDEIKDFAFISQKLDEVSLAIDSLNLWVDKTASENGLNIELLNETKEALKKSSR